MNKKGVCRICGVVHKNGLQPDFMASMNICADCYYKHYEPNNPYFSNKPITKESK